MADVNIISPTRANQYPTPVRKYAARMPPTVPGISVNTPSSSIRWRATLRKGGHCCVLLWLFPLVIIVVIGAAIPFTYGDQPVSDPYSEHLYTHIGNTTYLDPPHEIAKRASDFFEKAMRYRTQLALAVGEIEKECRLDPGDTCEVDKGTAEALSTLKEVCAVVDQIMREGQMLLVQHDQAQFRVFGELLNETIPCVYRYEQNDQRCSSTSRAATAQTADSSKWSMVFPDDQQAATARRADKMRVQELLVEMSSHFAKVDSPKSLLDSLVAAASGATLEGLWDIFTAIARILVDQIKVTAASFFHPSPLYPEDSLVFEKQFRSFRLNACKVVDGLKHIRLTQPVALANFTDRVRPELARVEQVAIASWRKYSQQQTLPPLNSHFRFWVDPLTGYWVEMTQRFVDEVDLLVGVVWRDEVQQAPHGITVNDLAKRLRCDVGMPGMPLIRQDSPVAAEDNSKYLVGTVFPLDPRLVVEVTAHEWRAGAILRLPPSSWPFITTVIAETTLPQHSTGGQQSDHDPGQSNEPFLAQDKVVPQLRRIRSEMTKAPNQDQLAFLLPHPSSWDTLSLFSRWLSSGEAKKPKG